MEEELEKTGEIKPARDERGRLLPGNTANPKGRPKGSISVISKIKQILQEIVKTSDGKERERVETLARNIVHMAINEQDKDMIKMIVNYVDGMPTQTINMGMDENVEKIEIEIKTRQNNENQPSSNNSLSEKSSGIPEQGT